MAAIDFDNDSRRPFWNPRAPKLNPTTGAYQDPTPAQTTPTPTPTWGGWNANNVFDSWDLVPLSQQTGVERDELATQRDLFLNPLLADYRRKRGPGNVDQTDRNVFDDPGFRKFAQTGMLTSAPDQFDDPYTNLLERMSKSQMGEIRSNPGLDQLTQFLTQRFQELSTAPGFSPDEMAMLNTQAFEPIESLRKAAQQRSTQRVAARGFLPSSGLAELDARNVDQDFDRMRTQANRDLAIQGINRRDQDLATAGQIASQLGLSIPQGQRAEELGLAQLLYGLPRNAMMDALAVVNGSPGTQDLFYGANSLAAQQQRDRLNTQQRFEAIARWLDDMWRER